MLVAVLAVASCLADRENRRRPGLRGKARAGARKVARHEDKVSSFIIWKVCFWRISYFEY